MAQHQQSAGTQAAREILQLRIEILETDEMIAALASVPGQVAPAQHREAEDGVVGGVRLRGRAACHPEPHAGVGPGAEPLAAGGDMARMDVQSGDQPVREVPAQACGFLPVEQPNDSSRGAAVPDKDSWTNPKRRG